ncbi:hypothetical protein HYH03_013437 [Edaphochlamys debaryana]|nr:hypothetical protein HYH03_013437 [Edaphochlamys debaryana]|eukprot:KAG2488000.1 hypothetical protein HYH03_013437 [Edaphochlamys debaryana]
MRGLVPNSSAKPEAAAAVFEVLKGDTVFVEELTGLQKDLQDVLNFVKTRLPRNFFERCFSASGDSSACESYVKKLDDRHRSLQTALMLDATVQDRKGPWRFIEQIHVQTFWITCYLDCKKVNWRDFWKEFDAWLATNPFTDAKAVEELLETREARKLFQLLVDLDDDDKVSTSELRAAFHGETPLKEQIEAKLQGALVRTAPVQPELYEKRVELMSTIKEALLDGKGPVVLRKDNVLPGAWVDLRGLARDAPGFGVSPVATQFCSALNVNSSTLQGSALLEGIVKTVKAYAKATSAADSCLDCIAPMEALVVVDAAEEALWNESASGPLQTLIKEISNVPEVRLLITSREKLQLEVKGLVEVAVGPMTEHEAKNLAIKALGMRGDDALTLAKHCGCVPLVLQLAISARQCNLGLDPKMLPTSGAGLDCSASAVVGAMGKAPT